MIVIIPLVSLPSQTLNVILQNQNCTINVYEKSTGVYFDLLVDGIAVVTTIICRDRVKLVRHKYLGFKGDFSFVDLQGTKDPVSSEIGSRYVLAYIE